MKLKAVSGIMLTLLLIGMLTLAFNIHHVKSDWTWTETIYIRADGSVDPPDAPIQRDGDIYTLTGNITIEWHVDPADGIVIERDNIVVDGAGYKVQGSYTGDGLSYGIDLRYRNNITIQNVEVTNFTDGIYLYYSNSSTVSGNTASNRYYGISLIESSNNILVGNTASNNRQGIYLLGSSNNTLVGNTASNNSEGIEIESSHNNTFVGNTASNNREGIYLISSSNNTLTSNNVYSNNFYGINFIASWYAFSSNNALVGNTISNNSYGIYFEGFSDGIHLYYPRNNVVIHNNFVNNTPQVYDRSWENPYFPPAINTTWDDGYPSGGNYWSDYTGVDLDYDGIGDTPYFIDEDNQDDYPLMGMFSSFPISYQEETYTVDVICNSTISSFEFDHENRIIDFDVTGSDGTIGFCRIVIPRALIERPYTILVDGQEIPYTELPISNITHVFLYFTYSHSTHHIKIFTSPPPPPVGGKANPIIIPKINPELQTIWIWLSIVMLSLVLTVVSVKKRKRGSR